MTTLKSTHTDDREGDDLRLIRSCEGTHEENNYEPEPAKNHADKATDMLIARFGRTALAGTTH